jgi:hypothetical protein
VQLVRNSSGTSATLIETTAAEYEISVANHIPPENIAVLA